MGAINTQLISCPWLNVTAIDLVSRHKKIKQCDFFALVPNSEYDVIVSSMVINCVPDAKQRGKMLRLYRSHLRPNGLVFLMLPVLCLYDSKYMTYDKFVDIVHSIGFEVVATKKSPKIAFFALKCAEPLVSNSSKYDPDYSKRNEFNVFI